MPDFGTLGHVPAPFLLRSDNGLVFTSRGFTALVKGYGLRQEFITPHNPQQNGMVERVISTLKEQCMNRHRFKSLQHTSRVINDWIGFCNQRRPHNALGMKNPVEAFKLAAGPVQISLGHYNQPNRYASPLERTFGHLASPRWPHHFFASASTAISALSLSLTYIRRRRRFSSYIPFILDIIEVSIRPNLARNL